MLVLFMFLDLAQQNAGLGLVETNNPVDGNLFLVGKKGFEMPVENARLGKKGKHVGKRPPEKPAKFCKQKTRRLRNVFFSSKKQITWKRQGGKRIVKIGIKPKRFFEVEEKAFRGCVFVGRKVGQEPAKKQEKNVQLWWKQKNFGDTLTRRENPMPRF